MHHVQRHVHPGMGMKVRGEDEGLFDCFILEETIITKSMMMKEITYDNNGNLISTMILNEVNYFRV